MALNLVKLSTSFLLLFFWNPFPNVESRTSEVASSSEHPFTKTLQNLKGAHKGQTMEGIRELKTYLKNFGYLNDHSTNTLTNNHFDANLESALKDFQTYHHLHVTGLLDTATIERMSLPRCGVPDITPQHKSSNGLVIAANYSFFPGSLKWGDSKRDLTYTYSSSADLVNMDDVNVRQAIESAFQSWSEVTDFTFTEVWGGSADVVIGFHSGDHGDGYPFDGPGRVLAHTFAPEDGRLHYDADEQWGNNPSSLHTSSRGSLGRRSTPKKPMAMSQIDLETVALHEIGHLIGLGHSSDQDAVMYPFYGGVKRNLRQDDVDGIWALYGYN